MTVMILMKYTLKLLTCLSQAGCVIYGESKKFVVYAIITP